jgi:hypothetical protein
MLIKATERRQSLGSVRKRKTGEVFAAVCPEKGTLAEDMKAVREQTIQVSGAKILR